MEKYCFEEKVQTAYERLQHPLAIFQLVDDLVVPVVLSDGFCELFGFDNQEQAYDDINQDFLQNIHPLDVAKFKSDIRRFATEGGEYDNIFRLRKKDETTYKVIRAVGKQVKTDDNVILGHIWFTDESTDVNQKIAGLQESVASLLANMPAMTFSKDVNTRKYLACKQAEL